MAPAVYNVALPVGTIAIVAPAQTASTNRFTFPNLKLKITPRVNIPADLAPHNVNAKTLEDNIKVIVAVGGKVSVTWKVDTKHLPLGDEDMDYMSAKVEMAIGEWLTLNQESLGVESFDYPDSSRDDVRGGELAFTPVCSLPSHSSLQSHIPSGEPVAYLTALEVSAQWSYPSVRSKKRPAEETSDEPEPGAEPIEPSQVEESSKDAVEIEVEDEVLAQVGLGMQKVMRLQMIRRFPYVFDGKFMEFQRSLATPSGVFDALNRFVTLSAQYGTRLVDEARELFELLQESQARALLVQVDAMARLPVRAHRGRVPKRPKVESQQTESPASLAESQEQQREDDCVNRITTYLEALELEEENKSVDDQLHDSIKQGLSAIGVAQWMQVRVIGRGRMSAYKAFLREPEHFHEVLPAFASEPTEEAVWDLQTPLQPPSGHHHPPTESHGPHIPLDMLQAMPELEETDDLDDLDAEDCYDDESNESLGIPPPQCSELSSVLELPESYSGEHVVNNAPGSWRESHYPPSTFSHTQRHYQPLHLPRVQHNEDLDDDEYRRGGEWRAARATYNSVPHDLRYTRPLHPHDDLEEEEGGGFSGHLWEESTQLSLVTIESSAQACRLSSSDITRSHHSYEHFQSSHHEQSMQLDGIDEDFDDLEHEESRTACTDESFHIPPVHHDALAQSISVHDESHDDQDDLDEYQDDLDDLDEYHADGQAVQGVPDNRPLGAGSAFGVVDDLDDVEPDGYDHETALNVEYQPSFNDGLHDDDFYDDLDDE